MVKPGKGPHRLEILERGRLDRLGFTEVEVPGPGPGELRLKVQAIGLNFRFIVDALGLFPGNAGALGGDSAGVVTAVGEGVENFAVGDRVFGLIEAVIDAVVDDCRVVKIPANCSFEEASSFPVAYLTVVHGFRDIAKLRAGERVLIHSAAGGVGQIALQYAQHAGAEVYVTASPSKWDYLQSLGIAEERIASSRDELFAKKFRQLAGGMDVVLNSLAGELTDAGLSLLVEGGRFLEMGKTDIRDPKAVAQKYPHVLYRPFDIMPLTVQEPAYVQAALRKRGPHCER